MTTQFVSLAILTTAAVLRHDRRQQQQRLDQARANVHQALAEAERLLELAQQEEDVNVDGDSYDGFLDPPAWRGEQ